MTVDIGYADRYIHFMKEENGYRKLFRYLLDFDCKAAGYTPKMRAPDTGAKRRMVVESATNVTAWAMALRDCPDETLGSKGYALPFSLFRGQDLVALFKERYPDSRQQDNVIFSALRRAGFRQVLETEKGVQQVRITGWGKQRLWAIRRADTLRRMKEKELAAEFLRERGSLPPNLPSYLVGRAYKHPRAARLVVGGPR